MKLESIIKKTHTKFEIVKKSTGFDSKHIAEINIDSRLVDKDSAFFALKGIANNGNSFIENALKSGAKLIVSDQKFDEEITNYDCTFILADNCFEVLVEFLQIFYHNLPQNIYAITGTNGKTSTAEFIRQILQLIGKNSASIGTLGIRCDQKINNIPNSNLTTPDIVSTYKILSILKENNIDDVAIEVSSIGLEQQRIAGLKVNIGIFTNISQDHLDYHKTMSEYLRCKMLLFSKVLQQGAIAIINSDIKQAPQIRNICQEKQLHICDYGFNAKSFKINKIEHNDLAQEVSFNFEGKQFSFKINSSAQFEAYNIFCALSAVIANNKLSLDNIKQLLPQLTNLKSASGRMERVAILPNKAQIFIDFAHTPDSLQKILEETRKMTKSRLIILVGCGGNRDAQKRPIMGKIATDFADIAVITDDNPRFEDPAKIRQEVMAGCNKEKAIEIDGRQEAIKQAIAMLKNEDILILAGKGHEKYQIIDDQKLEFDEEKIVKQIIN